MYNTIIINEWINEWMNEWMNDWMNWWKKRYIEITIQDIFTIEK